MGVAKGEIIENLPANGCAILNADNQEVMKQAQRTRAQTLTFGEKGEIRASDIELDAELRPSFQIETPWGREKIFLQVRGKHMVPNALAASAIGLFLNMDLSEISAGLSKGTLSPARMEFQTASSGLLVINDAYNANPVSTKAALEALASIKKSGRKVAVLGLMAELGTQSSLAHKEIAEYAQSLELELFEVSEADADTIETFLDDRAGDNAAFDFTPPGELTSSKFVCETWSKSIPYLNRATIQATFREVFEP